MKVTAGGPADLLINEKAFALYPDLRKSPKFHGQKDSAVYERSRVSYSTHPTTTGLRYGMAWGWAVYFCQGRLAMPLRSIDSASSLRFFCALTIQAFDGTVPHRNSLSQ